MKLRMRVIDSKHTYVTSPRYSLQRGVSLFVGHPKPLVDLSKLGNFFKPFCNIIHFTELSLHAIVMLTLTINTNSNF